MIIFGEGFKVQTEDTGWRITHEDSKGSALVSYDILPKDASCNQAMIFVKKFIKEKGWSSD